MVMERKTRIAPRDAKRWRTIRKTKPYAEIIRDLQKAGRMSTKHFDSKTGVDANRIRWDRYYREHPEKLAARKLREKEEK